MLIKVTLLFVLVSTAQGVKDYGGGSTRTLIKEGKANCSLADCVNVCMGAGGQGPSIAGTVKVGYAKSSSNVFCTSHNYKTNTDETSGLTGCLVYTPTTEHAEDFPGASSGNYIDAVCGLPRRGTAGHLIDALKEKGSEVHLTCVPCLDDNFTDLNTCQERSRLDLYYANTAGFSYWNDDAYRQNMRERNFMALMSWRPVNG